MNLFALLDELVNGELVVAGHRGDFAADSFARAHEERKNELRRVEAGLADQRAHGLGRTQPSRPVNGKGHVIRF